MDISSSPVSPIIQVPVVSTSKSPKLLTIHYTIQRLPLINETPQIWGVVRLFSTTPKPTARNTGISVHQGGSKWTKAQKSQKVLQQEAKINPCPSVRVWPTTFLGYHLLKQKRQPLILPLQPQVLSISSSSLRWLAEPWGFIAEAQNWKNVWKWFVKVMGH